MDMLAYCRAMAAFCRQRAAFEDQNDAFWIIEAEKWDKLISDYASPQSEIRTGQTAPSRRARLTTGMALNCLGSSPSQNSEYLPWVDGVKKGLRSPANSDSADASDETGGDDDGSADRGSGQPVL
jgi:hypothetical protein